MRKKKFGIMRKRILSLLIATMMISSSALTTFATDDISFSDDTTTEITEQIPDETDVPDETPDETDVSEETPDETDVPEETPDETDVPEETPDETDVPDETPEEEIKEDSVLIEHFISDVEGEELIPYEYHVMEYIDDGTDTVKSTQVSVPSYYSSYYSSQVNYNGTVGYNSLTADQKKAYDMLYDIACTIDESAVYDASYMSKYDNYYFPELECSIPIADVDTDSLFTVFIALRNDNPQFFWMGHAYVLWGNGTHIVGFQFGLDDSALDYLDGDDRMQVKEELFTEIESVLEGAEAYGNDYSKEWYIHNYLCEKTVYDLTGPHAHDISGLLVDERAVCESYAKTFQLFMNALDIDVLYVTGTGNGGGHAWNQIGLENNGVTEWYNVDVTWDDEAKGYGFDYFNVVDSDGTSCDFTYGFVSEGKRYNEHTPKKSGDSEYVYPVNKCTSTTFSYKNHAKNFKLASTKPIAKIGETEYTSLEDALYASTEGDTITLLADAEYNDFDMPEHDITIDCAGYVIDFINDSDEYGMDMKADLTIKNVGGKTLAELGGANKIDLRDFDYIYLNGNTLTFEGTWEGFIPVLISGYDSDINEDIETGTVYINTDDDCNILGVTGVADFRVEEDTYANVSFGFYVLNAILPDNAVLNIEYGVGEINSLNIADTAWLSVSTDEEDPFFVIYDGITGDIVNVKAGNMEEGLATVVSRIKYSVDKFNFVYITDEGEEDRYVTRINGDGHYLYGPFETEDFTISDGENSVKRCTFAEAIEYIDEQNVSTVAYTITYEGEDITVQNDFTFGNAKSITFEGNPITFNGDITLDTNIVFETGVILNGDLLGEGKKVTFASGDAKSEIYCPNIDEVNITVDNCEVVFKDKKAVTENVISIPTFTLKGNTDVRFEGIDKISIENLDTNGDGNTMYFDKGKVEIGNIYYRGLTTFSIGSGEVLNLIGNIMIYNSKKIIIHSESATRNDKIMTVGKDLSQYFTTEMTNAAGAPFSVVYRDNTLVYDVPVYRLEGVGIFSEWNDILAYINKNGSSETEYEVTLLCDAEVEKLVLPAATKAKSVTFSGGYIITLANTTLPVPVDTYFECDVVAEDAAITVSAGKTLSITNGAVKSITGSSTSTLSAETLYVENVKTFNTVECLTINLAGNMTGVNNFGGNLELSDSESKVNITNIASDSVFSYNTGDELPDVTVNGVSEDATLTIDVNNGAPLTSGTVVLKSSSDIADEDYEGGSIVIENKGENGEDLAPYFYSTTKVIKAECPDAITLIYNDVNKNFPNIDKVFEEINENKDKTIDYRIAFLTPTTFDGLTIPTYANSIVFRTPDNGTALTYTGKTLKLPVDTYFDCEFYAENTAIIASNDVGFERIAIVKSITGTEKSNLTVTGTLNAQDVKTFADVLSSGCIAVNGTMNEVTNFKGKIVLETPKSNATITNVGYMDATLVTDESGNFGKLTVNEVDGTEKIYIRVDTEFDKLENGTPIMYSQKDITGNIVIENKTDDEKDLAPFYYPKTKTIKAEWAGAITLSYGNVEKDLPNIDKVFEEINANNDKTIDYKIKFNAPVEYNKLTIPAYANSITFAGEDMTFTGTSLKLPVNTYFECDLTAENTAITASKNITIGNAIIKNLTGTKNSVLTVTNSLEVVSLKTFGDVNSEGLSHVDGTMSGIVNFGGNLRLTNPKATATITNLDAESYIELLTDESGKFPKLTINGASSESVTATIIVFDEECEQIAIPSGTIVAYSSKDISENIIIENKTSDDNPLTAFYYKKDKSIKAEWEDTITLSYDDTIANLPNIDKVFEIISANKDKTIDYTIDFNIPMEFNKLTIPTYANSITFKGEDVTFTGKTLKFPVKTTVECKLIAENTAVTASKDLLVSDASDVTVNSLTGTAKSNLIVEGMLSVQTLKTFANVNAISGKVVADTSVTITEFEGDMTAGPEATVTIKTIPVDAMTAYINLVSDENGKFGKLNLTNVNTLTHISVIDEEGEYVSLISNIPVAYAPSDISENIFILNTSLSPEEYHPAYYVNDKKAVYSGYQDAVTVHYVDAEEINYEKSFTNLEEAIAYIPLDALIADIYLNRDVRAEEFSVPKYECGRLGFEGNGNRILLDGITSVSFKTMVVLNVITVDSTEPFTISTTDDILFADFNSSTLTSVSGKSTKSIVYSGNSNNANYNISGFGTLDMVSGPVVDVNKGLTVKNILYCEAVLNILPDAELKLTNLNPQNENLISPLTMVYYDGASPVKITGTVKGEVILKHQNKFTSGEQLFVASKADLSKFTINENSLPDEKEYILTRKSGKVYIKPIVFEVSDGTTDYKYADWSDFATMANKEKTPETDYVVNVLDDYNAGESISMPKAGYYSSIKLVSADETPDTFTFRSGIKQTGNLIIDNINLCSVNSKEVETAYTFTVGKYSLTATDVDFGKVSALTASGDSVVSIENCYIDGKLTVADATLSDVTVTGAVKATKTLTLNGTATFGNTVNVYGFSGEGSVILTNGKLLTVGKGGSGEDTITITLKTPITAKTKVGTVPQGYYNDNFVGENVDIVVEGTVIYAYPKA